MKRDQKGELDFFTYHGPAAGVKPKNGTQRLRQRSSPGVRLVSVVQS